MWHRARQRARLKDGPCTNRYVGVVSEVMISVRWEVAARLAMHASVFVGVVAECSGV